MTGTHTLVTIDILHLLLNEKTLLPDSPQRLLTLPINEFFAKLFYSSRVVLLISFTKHFFTTFIFTNLSLSSLTTPCLVEERV